MNAIALEIIPPLGTLPPLESPIVVGCPCENFETFKLSNLIRVVVVPGIALFDL